MTDRLHLASAFLIFGGGREALLSASPQPLFSYSSHFVD